jgi:asparagine synthase (glutamine-hydrolysing)
MCGIVGIHSYLRDHSPVDLGEVVRIRDAMTTRGPDGDGLWHDSTRRIAFGHRRLAIIDITDAGAQPMLDEQHGIVIIFNGEIYNFRGLRAQFETRGYKFRSNSDTEVLLAGYAIHGPEMVRMLRGMFAFAIWDERKQQLFLARDPLGIKPLYYSKTGSFFRFASQVNALRAGGVVGHGDSMAGHVGFFLWGHIPDPFTLYSDIKSLPAGNTLTVSERGVSSPRPYWSLQQALLSGAECGNAPADEEGRRLLLRGALKSSVEHHLVSDVPLGMFLSSGRDSATVLGLTRELVSAPLQTFTLGFREFKNTPSDEAPLAEQVADKYGTNHKTLWITREDFLADLDNFYDAMDQPSIDGVNTYMVCREGHRFGVKVALTGLGGDELFGGYPSFHQVPAMVRAVQRIPFAHVMGRRVRKVLAPVLSYLTSPKYAALIEYGLTISSAYLLRRALFMPWEIDNILGPHITRAGLEELDVERTLYGSFEDLTQSHAIMLTLEMSFYMRDRLLRDSDWASMAHSVELRTPLVDHVLLETLAPTLTSGRPFTKNEMSMTPERRLPDAVLHRRKTGFEVPVREWSATGAVANTKNRGLRSWARMVYARQIDRPAIPAANDSRKSASAKSALTSPVA